MVLLEFHFEYPNHRIEMEMCFSKENWRIAESVFHSMVEFKWVFVFNGFSMKMRTIEALTKKKTIRECGLKWSCFLVLNHNLRLENTKSKIKYTNKFNGWIVE